MKALIQLSLAAIAAVFTVSCAKETPIIDRVEKPIDTPTELVTIDAPVDMTFTGITDNEPGTKTVLSGLNINWSPEEKIYLFDGTAPRAFTSTNDTEASTVSFSGTASSAANYYAVYPSGTIAGKVISTTIPAIQVATANSFAPKANVAVAYTESDPTGTNVLQFKNVGAVVKFQLTNDNVRKVKLEAINGEKMSGPVNVTFDEGSSFTTSIVTAEAESCVVLDGGDDDLSPLTPYYLAIYPNTFDDGFKITLIKSDGSFRSFSNPTSNTLERNDLMDMGTLPEVTTWKTGGAIDELNYTLIGVSGTSYTDWSGKSDASSAVYKGKSAGGNTSIQLKSADSISGIVTTTSGGKVTKVEVSWNSNTASGRTLDIYGKTTAYTAASDLYDASTRGTKLGSIVYGTSTQLTITGDYTFIGIRSNSGALYLDELNITWGDPSVTPPTLPTVDAPSTEIKNISGTTVPLAGGSITFDVDSNVPWTVATNEPSYSSVSVSGSTVTVTFSTLDSGTRTATVTVTPAEGSAPDPVVITQKTIAVTKTVTFTVNGAVNNVALGGDKTDISATMSSNGAMNNGDIQLAGKSTARNVTITISGMGGKTITGASVKMRSNASSGSGALTLVSNGTTIASISNSAFNVGWYSDWSTSLVDVELTVSETTIDTDKTVVMTITTNANSLYFNKLSIDYTE